MPDAEITENVTNTVNTENIKNKGNKINTANMTNTVGIGIQDFLKLRENHNFYIDKTSFIKEWWESGDDVTLITRLRRFGKTLNMSMVEECLCETVEKAIAQIEEKQYETDLIARGILKEKIRKYGFAFEGKNVLIGA